MSLDENYNELTLLSKWWKQVKSNFALLFGRCDAAEEELAKKVNDTDYANGAEYGIIKLGSGLKTYSTGHTGVSTKNGVRISGDGAVIIDAATDEEVKAGTEQYKPLTPKTLTSIVGSVDNIEPFYDMNGNSTAPSTVIDALNKLSKVRMAGMNFVGYIYYGAGYITVDGVTEAVLNGHYRPGVYILQFEGVANALSIERIKFKFAGHDDYTEFAPYSGFKTGETYVVTLSNAAYHQMYGNLPDLCKIITSTENTSEVSSEVSGSRVNNLNNYSLDYSSDGNGILYAKDSVDTIPAGVFTFTPTVNTESIILLSPDEKQEIAGCVGPFVKGHFYILNFIKSTPINYIGEIYADVLTDSGVQDKLSDVEDTLAGIDTDVYNLQTDPQFNKLTVTASTSTDTETIEPLKVRDGRIDIFKRSPSGSTSTTFIKIDNTNKTVTVDSDSYNGQIKLSGIDLVGDTVNTLSNFKEISSKKITVKSQAGTQCEIEQGRMSIGTYVGADNTRYPTATLTWDKNLIGGNNTGSRKMNFNNNDIDIAIDSGGTKLTVTAPQFVLRNKKANGTSGNPDLVTTQDGLKLRSGVKNEKGGISSIHLNQSSTDMCGDIKIVDVAVNCTNLPEDITQEEIEFLNGYLLNNLIKLRRDISQTNLQLSEKLDENFLSNGFVGMGEVTSTIDALEKQTIYSTAPKRVGTWVDGTPVWRFAFQQEFTDYNRADKDVYVNMPISDITTAFVINAWCAAFIDVPCCVDDVLLSYNVNGNFSGDCIAEKSGDEYIYTGAYGWIEFVTPESNIQANLTADVQEQ